MTPTLAVQFSAAADGRKIVIDQDVVLIGVQACSNRQVIVSKDSATTIANSVTLPGNLTDENILAISAGAWVTCSVPLSAGQSVFVSSSGAGSAVLMFDLLLIP